MQNKVHGYFGLLEIGNSVAPLTSPFTVSYLTHLYDNIGNPAVKIQNLSDIVCSDMISKEIERSTTKTPLR